MSRRGFLAALAASLAGVRLLGAAPQGLEQFAVSAPPCKDDVPTPAVASDGTFKAGAPLRTALVEPGMAGVRLAVSGTVIGLSCGRIKDADVDVWQADASGAYDRAGFRLHGHQRTDKDGRYQVQTIVPGAGGGRAPHINLRVRIAGKADFWTSMYFEGRPENTRDPSFQPVLAVKLLPAPTGSGDTAVFDIVLDL